MKRILIVLGVLAAGFAAVLVAAFLLIDAEDYREPITEYASEALGRKVTLGGIDLRVFPTPAVRVQSLSVAGHEAGAPALADVAELQLKIAVLPLFTGQVVLRAVELESPRIFIPFDENGDPILPTPAQGPDAAQSPGAQASAPAQGESESDPAKPALAIQNIRVRNADLQAGPYAFSGGKLDGRFSLGGSTALKFDLADVNYAQDEVKLSGPVRGDLKIGESFEINLDDAALVSGDSFRKPAGDRLRISGPLGQELSAGVLKEASIELGKNEFPLRLLLEAEPMEIHLTSTEIDLAALQPFLGQDTPRLRGGVAVKEFRVKLEPLSIVGTATLHSAGVDLEQGPVSVSGPLAARGTVLALQDASAKIGQNEIGVRGSYDLERGRSAFEFDAREHKIEDLIGFFAGDSKLLGAFAAGGKFRMSGDLDTLSGSGHFAITPGQLRGFSLVQELLGPLSEIPVLVAQVKGKDLSRYEQEDFENLSADYTIENGVLHTDNLVLNYRYATANLRGTVGLVDLALDLSGEVVLGDELAEELSGSKPRRRRVIPISSIAGTVDNPRLRLDRVQLTRVAASLAAEDRAREKLNEKLDGRLGRKLEEKLGPGAKEAVQGIFGRLLGGQPEESPPSEQAPEPPAAEEKKPE
ncbi:MAG: AsmA family protein [bacterium]|nr:AsmA family protein [bacterium]